PLLSWNGIRPLRGILRHGGASRTMRTRGPPWGLRGGCRRAIIAHMKHLEAEAAGAESEERVTRSVFLLLLEVARAQQDRLEGALRVVGLSRAKMEALHQ